MDITALYQTQGWARSRDLHVCPIRQHAAQSPEAPAIYVGDSLLSYVQLDQQVAAVVTTLKSAGALPGDRLVFASADTLAFIEALFACLRLGMICIPVNPKFPASYALSLYAHVEPKWIIGGAVTTSTVAELSSNEPSSNKPDNDSLNSDGSEVHNPDCSNAIQINSILPFTGIFTSGSTSIPKLALHSFANHYASALGSQELMPLTTSDCWGLTLPVHHIAGLAIVMRVMIAGASLAISAGQELESLLQRHPVSHLSLVPAQLTQWYESNRQLADFRLRFVLIGGGSCSQCLLQWLGQQSVPVMISYGMTETASQVMTGPVNCGGYLKTLLPYREIKVNDAGEILVKGETLFMGYLLGRSLESARDGSGWYHTRDFGELTAEGLRVTGRMDNQFISGGENIQPEEIERAILSLLPLDACYVIPQTDGVYGMVPVSFIQPLLNDDDLQQLRAKLSAILPTFKIPKNFYLLPDKFAGTMKVSRYELTHHLNNHSALAGR